MFWDDEAKPAEPPPPIGALKRPASIAPAETMAEATLAKRLGWNLPVFRGKRGVDIYGGTGDYRLTGVDTLVRQRTPHFDVLRVSSFAKFGNAVRQMRNAFAVARAYEVKRVEFPTTTPFFAGNRAGKVEIAWGHTPVRVGQLDAPGLTGRFYHLDALGLKPAPSEQVDIVRRMLRPLLSPVFREPRSDIRDDDLALHFRGDDIFGASDTYIHREYGQPPASFYLAAVEREKPARVLLVHHDRANPTVSAVETALRAQGIETISQSDNLMTDVHVLLNATRIVAGVGSFVPAIAALSTRLRRLYLFGATVPVLEQLGVIVVEGRDISGDYMRAVRSNNWTASPEQIALMLSYPADALEFIEHAGAAAS